MSPNARPATDEVVVYLTYDSHILGVVATTQQTYGLVYNHQVAVFIHNIHLPLHQLAPVFIAHDGHLHSWNQIKVELGNPATGDKYPVL